MRPYLRAGSKWLAAGIGLAAATYAAYVGLTWYRYGDAGAAELPRNRMRSSTGSCRSMKSSNVTMSASPRQRTVTLAAAREMDLQGSGVVRTIIKAREMILGATPDDRPRPRGLLAEMQSLGWGVLADVPGREVVVGAVTRPWEANVTFRALPPDQFAAFSEPGYVKIAWTLRAEPIESDRITVPDRNACDRHRPRPRGRSSGAIGRSCLPASS